MHTVLALSLTVVTLIPLAYPAYLLGKLAGELTVYPHSWARILGGVLGAVGSAYALLLMLPALKAQGLALVFLVALGYPVGYFLTIRHSQKASTQPSPAAKP